MKVEIGLNISYEFAPLSVLIILNRHKLSREQTLSLLQFLL